MAVVTKAHGAFGPGRWGHGTGRLNLRRPTAGSAIRAPSLHAPACPQPDSPLSLAERRTASVPLLVQIGAVGRPARLPGRRQFSLDGTQFLLTFLVLQYRAVPIAWRVWAAKPINIGSFQRGVNSTPTPGTFNYGSKKSSLSVSG
jgi:hypothetical protein